MKRALAVLLSLVLSLSTVVYAQSAAFLLQFPGTPAQPAPYIDPSSIWVYVNGFDTREAATGATIAQHGPNCEPPGFPYDATNSHVMHTAADAVFICNGHLMTSPGLSGYSAIYMTPPALADFSSGPATIHWEMSTLRTSARDWVDVVLTPYGEHQELAYNNNDQHIPIHNIHVSLAGGGNVFQATERVGGGVAYGQGTDSPIPGDGATSWDDVFQRVGLQQSAARRDAFEIRLSDTHLSVCMPGYQQPTGGVFCWINSDLPERLDPAVWGGMAMVQFNHRVYNAEKACIDAQSPPDPNPLDQFAIDHTAYGDAHCPPDTWHWDNISIQPYVPFQIIPSSPAGVRVQSTAPTTVNFAAPAPAGAYLSFVSFSNTPDLMVSFDGGTTWQAPTIQPARAPRDGLNIENGEYVFTPIPEGSSSVMTRTGTGFLNGVTLEDFSVFTSPSSLTSTGPPTPTAAATVTPSPTASSPTPTDSPTPTLEPTSTPTPVPTWTPTAEPTVTATPLPCVVQVTISGEARAPVAC